MAKGGVARQRAIAIQQMVKECFNSTTCITCLTSIEMDFEAHARAAQERMRERAAILVERSQRPKEEIAIAIRSLPLEEE